MIYKTNDDKHFFGATEKQIVENLQDASYSPTVTTYAFMVEVAYRAKIQTGKKVRTTSVKNFIDDLVEAGLLVNVTVN